MCPFLSPNRLILSHFLFPLIFKFPCTMGENIRILHIEIIHLIGCNITTVIVIILTESTFAPCLQSVWKEKVAMTVSDCIPLHLQSVSQKFFPFSCFQIRISLCAVVAVKIIYQCKRDYLTVRFKLLSVHCL